MVNVLKETDLNLESLKERIRTSFLNKKLNKGVAQVVHSIDERKQISQIYLVGTLDFWYENSILKALKETEQTITVYRIPVKLRRLVYDVIKDLDINDKKRTKSRRFFLCRAFAL